LRWPFFSAERLISQKFSLVSDALTGRVKFSDSPEARIWEVTRALLAADIGWMTGNPEVIHLAEKRFLEKCAGECTQKKWTEPLF
jgi:hypothetical protein